MDKQEVKETTKLKSNEVDENLYNQVLEGRTRPQPPMENG
jgi:hypothetical protein